ncbi:non-canonical purine NTP pyrophosphatase, partial [Pseudomonas sp. MPR-R5A]
DKGKAMAELEPEEKSEISHRAHALRLLEKDLPTLFGEGQS